MERFIEDSLTTEEAFWVMWYFLQYHYELSGGTFDVSDILSASEPIGFNGLGHINFENPKIGYIAPIDNGMVWHWHEAVKKYREKGIPPEKELK